MRLRTRARACALQMLYQAEITQDSIGYVQKLFWQSENAPEHVREFANPLVEGTFKHRETIDSAIGSTADNWTLERMPVVDLCILRSATYELLFLVDIPSAVSINEAIELAKTYSTDDSPKFVNAILDRIKEIAPTMIGLEHLRTSGGNS